MLSFLGSSGRLCDGLSRREWLRVGGIGTATLTLPDRLRSPTCCGPGPRPGPAPPMDVASSALLEDLATRGLFEETLVVWMGEFGRTPMINGASGRDTRLPRFPFALPTGHDPS
jgi:hypothetical protein